MQNPSSYYVVPKNDGRIWADWQQSGRYGNNSGSSASSSTATLGECSSSSRRRRRPMQELPQCSALPISYSLTPPTPSTTDSDASSSSQISMESIPEYDEMPEIPFVSAQINYPDAWVSSDDPPERSANSSHTSFWSGIIGMRASSSKSSTDSRSSPVLGHTSERIFAPSRTSRKRSGSVSSMSSSRTRPAPAKSILSSSSSVRTRRRKAPSVKFLDVPTIHYEDDDYEDDHEREPSSCMSPPLPKKARGLSGFFSFKWLFGPPSSSSCSSPPSSNKLHSPKTPAKSKAAALERPSISGPFPLWDSPPLRTRGGARSGRGSGTSAASLRSMKSSGSIRSMRSCSSRLPTPTYWPR